MRRTRRSRNIAFLRTRRKNIRRKTNRRRRVSNRRKKTKRNNKQNVKISNRRNTRNRTSKRRYTKRNTKRKNYIGGDIPSLSAWNLDEFFDIVAEIFKKFYGKQGIFGISGNSDQAQENIEKLQEVSAVNCDLARAREQLEGVEDQTIITTILKEWLKESTTPSMIPREHFKDTYAILKMTGGEHQLDKDVSADEAKLFIDKLPIRSGKLLCGFINLLQRVAKENEQTKMDSENLTVALMPAVFREKTPEELLKDADKCKDFLKILIDHLDVEEGYYETKKQTAHEEWRALVGAVKKDNKGFMGKMGTALAATKARVIEDAQPKDIRYFYIDTRNKEFRVVHDDNTRLILDRCTTTSETHRFEVVAKTIEKMVPDQLAKKSSFSLTNLRVEINEGGSISQLTLRGNNLDDGTRESKSTFVVYDLMDFQKARTWEMVRSLVHTLQTIINKAAEKAAEKAATDAVAEYLEPLGEDLIDTVGNHFQGISSAQVLQELKQMRKIGTLWTFFNSIGGTQPRPLNQSNLHKIVHTHMKDSQMFGNAFEIYKFLAPDQQDKKIYVMDAAGSICNREHTDKTFKYVLGIPGRIAGISKVIYTGIESTQKIPQELVELKPTESYVGEYPSTEDNHHLLVCHTYGPDSRSTQYDDEEVFTQALVDGYKSCLEKTSEHASETPCLLGMFILSGKIFGINYWQTNKFDGNGIGELCVSYSLHSLSQALAQAPLPENSNMTILMNPHLITLSRRMVYDLADEEDHPLAKLLSLEKRLLVSHKKMMSGLNGKTMVGFFLPEFKAKDYSPGEIQIIQNAISKGRYFVQLNESSEVRFGINAYCPEPNITGTVQLDILNLPNPKYPIIEVNRISDKSGNENYEVFIIELI